MNIDRSVVTVVINLIIIKAISNRNVFVVRVFVDVENRKIAKIFQHNIPSVIRHSLLRSDQSIDQVKLVCECAPCVMACERKLELMLGPQSDAVASSITQSLNQFLRKHSTEQNELFASNLNLFASLLSHLPFDSSAAHHF